MLIGIDASRATIARPTGTEVYSRHLVQALLALGSPHRFRLYFRDPIPPGSFPGADLRFIPFPRLWTHLRLSWEMVRRPPDALFVPAHVVPLVHPDVSLVTVHDLGYLHFPQAHPWRQRFYLDLSTRWSVRVSAHVLADSAATGADLVTRYGVPPGKVTVAYPGRDEGLAPVLDPAEVEVVKARHGIGGDYFLYVGTLQPRKNLARLVEAFAAFRQRAGAMVGERGTLLVLAGKRGWLYDDLFKQVRRLGMEGHVCFPGYISDEEKAALMSGALAFLFPSLYEGFGLPVLEAQACGCPVITSTTSSLPEIAGNGALLVDPRDAMAIAAAMERVTSDPVLRENLVERGLANVSRFSWTACARTVLSALEQSVRSMV
jgi:glycosyltransferase involved in cell wall biosynthesis